MDYEINYEVGDVYKVKTVRGSKTVEVKRQEVAVYFPETTNLYLSESPGWCIHMTRPKGSPMDSVMIELMDGFKKSFRVAKDGSARYFEKGKYVSMLVGGEETVCDISQRIKVAVKDVGLIKHISDLKKKEEDLSRKLETVRKELEGLEKVSK